MDLRESPSRFLVLLLIAACEFALIIWLRWSPWIVTGEGVKGILLAFAAILPVAMVAISLWRSKGRFGLRGIMVLTLAIACYLSLLPLFAEPQPMTYGPERISGSVKFAVYEMKTTSSTETKGLTYIEPFSDTQVSVHDMPVLTTSDISGIRLKTNPHEANFETVFTFYLAPKNVGEQGIAMQRGTGLVVVVNGRVVATPTLLSPIENEFYLTGFDSAEAMGLFRELTTGRANSNLTADPSEASVER